VFSIRYGILSGKIKTNKTKNKKIVKSNKSQPEISSFKKSAIVEAAKSI